MKATLYTIKNNRMITPEQDRQFLFEIQYALLLALQEAEILNFMQVQEAEKQLQQQMNIWRDI